MQTTPLHPADPQWKSAARAQLTDKQRNVAWYGLLLLWFAVFYLFNCLAPLMSDDYNYAFSFATRERITSFGELFPSLVTHYLTSNGRMITHFFAQLMLWIGKPVFNIVNALVAVSLLVGLCRLTSERKRDVQLLALFGSSLIIVLPTLAQVLFWLTGACNYLWGSTLIIWTMVPFRRMLLDTPQRLRWWHWIAIVPAYLFMGTVSENGAPAAILFMALCCAYQLLRRRRVDAWMWVAIALSTAGFVVMLLSPASQARNARSLATGASFLGKYLVPFTRCVQFFLQYELVPACVFLCLFAFALSAKASQERLTLAGLLFLCGLASHFAMSATGAYPLRAMTVSLLMLMSASAVLLPTLRRTALRPWLLCATLSLSLMAGMLCLQAAPQTYERFRQAQVREQRMLEAQSAGNLEVLTCNISSRTKFDVFYDMIDLTYDPDYYANAVFARYYGLNSVIINELQ
ncbi:MAG: DUF6056 family protein [Clostridia bacterium]